MSMTIHHPGLYALAPSRPGLPAAAPALAHAPVDPHATTVVGVPLLPGERVVYVHQARARTPRLQVVTTLRVIDSKGRGAPVSLWLQNIRAVTAVRQDPWVARLLFFLLAGPVGWLLHTMLEDDANRKRDRAPQTSSKHWERCAALVLVAHGGAKYRLDSEDAGGLGLLLAGGMVLGGFEHLPTVGYPA